MNTNPPYHRQQTYLTPPLQQGVAAFTPPPTGYQSNGISPPGIQRRNSGDVNWTYPSQYNDVEGTRSPSTYLGSDGEKDWQNGGTLRQSSSAATIKARPHSFHGGINTTFVGEFNSTLFNGDPKTPVTSSGAVSNACSAPTATSTITASTQQNVTSTDNHLTGPPTPSIFSQNVQLIQQQQQEHRRSQQQQALLEQQHHHQQQYHSPPSPYSPPRPAGGYVYPAQPPMHYVQGHPFQNYHPAQPVPQNHYYHPQQQYAPHPSGMVMHSSPHPQQLHPQQHQPYAVQVSFATHSQPIMRHASIDSNSCDPQSIQSRAGSFQSSDFNSSSEAAEYSSFNSSSNGASNDHDDAEFDEGESEACDSSYSNDDSDYHPENERSASRNQKNIRRRVSSAHRHLNQMSISHEYHLQQHPSQHNEGIGALLPPPEMFSHEYSSSSGGTTTRKKRVAKQTKIPAPIPVPHLMKRSRGRHVPSDPRLVRKNKGGKVYECTVEGCGKCFGRAEHLKRHVRSLHTNEKPFTCPHPTCGKEFSRHDNLNQHFRIHRHSAADRAAMMGMDMSQYGIDLSD